MAVNLLSILKSTNLPVAYMKFDHPQKPPYVIYRSITTNNVAADNMVFSVIEDYMIELYSNARDLISEGKIENALNQNKIFWNRSQTYIDSEKLNLAAYSIQV